MRVEDTRTQQQLAWCSVEQIDEERLEELKKQDVLTELMAEMGDSLPEMKRVLIDERDIYLAEKIKTTPGTRLVAVHVDGVRVPNEEETR